MLIELGAVQRLAVAAARFQVFVVDVRSCRKVCTCGYNYGNGTECDHADNNIDETAPGKQFWLCKRYKRFPLPGGYFAAQFVKQGKPSRTEVIKYNYAERPANEDCNTFQGTS